MSAPPDGFEPLVEWLETTHQLYIHNLWRWNIDLVLANGVLPWYCSLSTPRLHLSNKVYSAGKGQTPLEALQNAYQNYLNPPTKPLTKISKKEIQLELEDLGL